MKVRVNIHCYVFVIISYVKVVFYNYMSARWVFCDLCVLQLTENVLLFLIGMKKNMLNTIRDMLLEQENAICIK